MAAREFSTLGRAFACCSGKHGKVLAMSEVIDTRYPIGRFSAPATSGPEIRAAHIQTIRLLPERLQAAVKGLNDAQLDTPYREGGWTVRQLVHHLARKAPLLLPRLPHRRRDPAIGDLPARLAGKME